MRHIKLILEYDGAGYNGWQSQTNGKAIQDVVSQALSKMIEEKVTLRGASRTDAGVHALAQVATFETVRDISCNGFLRGLNTLLPEDIRVKHCEEVAIDFHPIKDAKWKEYHYLLDMSEVPSALNRNRAWWMGPKLDIAKMEKASRCLIGEHDFKSFQSALSASKTTVRRIAHLSLRGAKGDEAISGLLRSARNDNYTIQFIGNGFLKYMIRNIVGTLVEVGQGRRPVSEMQKILEAKDRKKAGFCAPAFGLYLVKIGY